MLNNIITKIVTEDKISRDKITKRGKEVYLDKLKYKLHITDRYNNMLLSDIDVYINAISEDGELYSKEIKYYDYSVNDDDTIDHAYRIYYTSTVLDDADQNILFSIDICAYKQPRRAYNKRLYGYSSFKIKLNGEALIDEHI